MEQQFLDTFAGNGYQIGGGNILPRYYPEDNNKVCTGKKEDGAKILVDSVNVIFYGLRIIRLNQYPFKSGKKYPKCFSTDFKVPSGGEEQQKVENCASCPLKEWSQSPDGKRIAPECAEVKETIVYDVDAKNYGVIQWKKTGSRVWSYIEATVFKNLMRMTSFNPRINPIVQFVFNLTSKQTVTNGMEHAIFSPKIARELTAEEKPRHAIAAGGAYQHLLLRQSSELMIEGGADYSETPAITAAPIAPTSPVVTPAKTDEELPPNLYDEGRTPGSDDDLPVNDDLPEENENFQTLEERNSNIAQNGPMDEPPF